MRQPGRRSGVALATLSTVAGRQPSLVMPATLTAGEKAVWHRVVDRTPAGWFQPEMLDLVVSYVAHTAEAQRLRKAAHSEGLELRELAMLSDMARRESLAALRFATALRLTVHSRLQSISAGRRGERLRPSGAIDALFEASDD